MKSVFTSNVLLIVKPHEFNWISMQNNHVVLKMNNHHNHGVTDIILHSY